LKNILKNDGGKEGFLKKRVDRIFLFMYNSYYYDKISKTSNIPAVQLNQAFGGGITYDAAFHQGKVWLKGDVTACPSLRQRTCFVKGYCTTGGNLKDIWNIYFLP